MLGFGLFGGADVRAERNYGTFPYQLSSSCRAIMANEELLRTLQHQLKRYESAAEEFSAIEAHLQAQEKTARVVDMIRINRQTIGAMRRSADLIKERIAAAQVGDESLPESASTVVHHQ